MNASTRRAVKKQKEFTPPFTMSDKKAKPALAPSPFPDGKEARPHQVDTAPAAAPTPSPKPTPPNAQPMAPGSMKTPENTSDKLRDMESFRVQSEKQALTTNLGVRISDNQNTLRAGERGPGLLEDTHFFEKISHFDQERIPERVVHARGSGAHGYFQVYRSLSEYTRAAFLQNPEEKTPVFVRFSTVQGFRGSPDTVRDIRGWATKFYTREGNFDLVGNNTPVFFIQDAIKFPDFVHAVKPEPHNEVPQGQSAHDSFWDFVSLQPETLHNVMWAMSDRGIPRSFRTMEGFGIHTYRLINAEGKSHFVRFHWKPLSGKASLLWDEAQLLTGRDPDFHRKDLWQAIEAGDYPEYELGLQILSEEQAAELDFDILDATKLIPEALIPVLRVGKMTLNRNPDNFFAETEQAAFCPANIVPGIDFSDDPLLQGRIFSYSDAQRHRLGGPNFTELPINRPICPFHNHQRDGQHRLRIDISPANYEPHSIGNNWPRETPADAQQGSLQSYRERVLGMKERLRSPSFAEYYAQPRLFWLSQTEPEKQHIINAFSFELGKVMRPYIREGVVDLLTRIDPQLAEGVARQLGLKLTREQQKRPLPSPVNGLEKDPTLSLYADQPCGVLKGRRVSLPVSDGVSHKSLSLITKALMKEGIHPMILAPRMGEVTMDDGEKLTVGGALEGNPSVLFDAVIVPEGRESIDTLLTDGDALYHLAQAYKHLKAIALPGEARPLAEAAGLLEPKEDVGLILTEDTEAALPTFLTAMKAHRVWSREKNLAAFPA